MEPFWGGRMIWGVFQTPLGLKTKRKILKEKQDYLISGHIKCRTPESLQRTQSFPRAISSSDHHHGIRKTLEPSGEPLSVENLFIVHVLIKFVLNSWFLSSCKNKEPDFHVSVHSNSHMTPDKLLWLAGGHLTFFPPASLVALPRLLWKSLPPPGGEAYLFLLGTSRWQCCIIVVMSSCSMQQHWRIFWLILDSAQHHFLPLPACWHGETDATTCCPPSPYWSAGPKQDPPVRWQETV